jgi:hypothetical protein
MIETYSENPNDYADKKWARILVAKAASKGINLADPKFLLATHRILDRPLRSLAASLLDK